MPAPEDNPTPAAGRRFLPPTSHSAGPQSSTASSARKSAVRFSRAGALPSSSASALAHSQRFGTPARLVKDEINTSFDESSSSPSLASTKQIFVPYAVSGRDAIDDSESADHDEGGSGTWNYGLKAGEDRSSIHLPSHGELYTPMPKRRKIFRPAEPLDQVLEITSSPSDDEQVPSDTSNVDYDDPDPLAVSNFNNGGDAVLNDPVTPHTSSRFRSHLSSTPSHTVSQLKPTFKVQGRESDASGLITSSAVPDIFSPSRRKGKKDYLPGGFADVVRNWILSVATEEAQGGGHQRAEQIIQVEHVIDDTSGRCATITSGDDGQRWLLVGVQGKERAGRSASTVGRVQPGSSVVVRGNATTWSLPADTAAGLPGIRVAADWDLQP